MTKVQEAYILRKCRNEALKKKLNRLRNEEKLKESAGYLYYYEYYGIRNTELKSNG